MSEIDGSLSWWWKLLRYVVLSFLISNITKYVLWLSCLATGGCEGKICYCRIEMSCGSDKWGILYLVYRMNAFLLARLVEYYTIVLNSYRAERKVIVYLNKYIFSTYYYVFTIHHESLSHDYWITCLFLFSNLLQECGVFKGNIRKYCWNGEWLFGWLSCI